FRHTDLFRIPCRQTRSHLLGLGYSHAQHSGLERPVLPDDGRPLLELRRAAGENGVGAIRRGQRRHTRQSRRKLQDQLRLRADTEIAHAIKRAQENLLRQQRPDGHWCGELIVDSTLCSDFVLFMHWFGEVDEELQQRCVRHILKHQLPNGGWNIYYGGPSEINPSVKAYFALKLAGYSPDSPFMAEARANLLPLGGIPRLNTFSKLYLALLGQFPWKYLPAIPVEMVLLPSWAPFNIYKMSSWSRAMLVPLEIINHFNP